MRTFFRVFGFAKNVGWRFVLYSAFMLISVIFSALNLAMLMPLLQVLFNPDRSSIPESAPGSFRLNIEYLTEYFNYYFNSIIVENGPQQALFFVCVIVFISVLIKMRDGHRR